MGKKKHKKKPQVAEQLAIGNLTLGEGNSPITFESENPDIHDNSFVLIENLADIIYPSAAPIPLFNQVQIDGMVINKQNVVNIIASYKNMELIRDNLRIEQSKNSAFRIGINIQLSSGRTFKSLVDVENYLEELCAEALANIEFLRSMYKKYLEAAQYANAATEMQIIVDFCNKLFGSNHFHTLTAQLDHKIALIFLDLQQGKDLHQLIQQIKNLIDLINTHNSNEAKRANAIAFYMLAQAELRQENYSQAEQYLLDSEHLRLAYNAPEIEIDRIRFMRGQLAYRAKDLKKSEELLLQSYELRKSKDPLNRHLIPVLDLLIDIKKRNGTRDEQGFFINHLLSIQVDMQLDKRQIISTQLRLLEVLQFHAPEEEYWRVMESIHVDLNNILVTGENIHFLECFTSFANTRMNTLLPQEWSNTRKRAYHSDTLRIITKAQLHANIITDRLRQQQVKEHLSQLHERSIFLMNAFDDPTAHRLIGEEPHPEDQLALEEQQIDEQNGNNTANELFHLSEFSSEARHSQVAPEDRILTVEEFAMLDNTGLINPFRLRAAQGGYNAEGFRDHQTLEEMLQSLIDNPNYTHQVNPIEIGVHEGKVYSFDTRRLITHQKARETNAQVQVRYRKISGTYLQQRIDAIFSPRPWNGLVTAARFDGKDGYSEPYINPALRQQLELKVAKNFKYDPSSRSEGVDSNGFPTKKKKAEKIYNFLTARKENGSEFAATVLKQMGEIHKQKGPEAAYDFLISQKENVNNNFPDRNNTPSPEPDGLLPLPVNS